MQVFDLFPTAVGCFEFPREFTKKELKFFEDQELRPNQGNMTGCDYEILNKRELKEVKTFLQECLDTYFDKTFRPLNDTSAYITHSWINVTTKDQYHHSHTHANSFLSGVFYIDASPDREDKIIFNNRLKRYDWFEIVPRDYNEYNSQTWWLPVVKRMVYIFPSNLEHNVPPVSHDGKRVSIAFNTFLKGHLGNNETKTGLYL